MTQRKPSPFLAPAVRPLQTLEERLADAEVRAAWFETAYQQQLDLTARLEQRIEALERRLALSSRTSSKPPSSDGLKKPKAEKRTRSLRGKSGRKPGGQPGHKGETLRQSPTPDHITDHYPKVCDGCGAALSAEMSEGSAARQVIELPPPPPPEVTEHRAHRCRCGRCGAVTRGGFPSGVNAPVQYGPRIAGIASYLQTHHCIPEDRLAQVMADLFRLPVVPATLARLIGQTADRLQPFADTVLVTLSGPQTSVAHLDETGLRVEGQTQWQHVICSPLLSHFRISARRGELLAGVSGCVVHDHWAPYFTMEGVEHALCNAHHLRELQALIEFEKEAWAATMKNILLEARGLSEARRNGVEIGIGVTAEVMQRYDVIIAEALAFHEAQPPLIPISQGKKRRGRPKRRTGHNLALRLQQRKTEVLRFLTDPNVPFTNNEAERDLRMGKVRQKVSGCFRAMRGAEVFCTLRTVINTARKQGWSIIETLMKPADQLILALRMA